MNLFKQAMYSKKIRSKEDAPKNTNNRDIMCSQGITGVKAGSLSHGQKWRQHKYLYKEGDRYVYPEDVQKKESGNDTLKKVGDAILSTNKLTKYPYLAYKAGNKVKPKTVKADEPVGHEKYPESSVIEEMIAPGSKQLHKSYYNSALDKGQRAKTRAKSGVAKKNTSDLYRSRTDMEDAWKFENRAQNKKYNDSIYIREKRLKNKMEPQIDRIIDENESREKRAKAAEAERANRREAIEKEKEENKKLKNRRGRKKPDSIGSMNVEGRKTVKELERQKAKTYARKRLKNDDVNRFGKDPAIDNDPEVRAARKKWLGYEENDGKIRVSSNSAAGKSINKSKLLDSVNSTPHEGSKRKVRMERNTAGSRAAAARNEYLEARQRAAEKEYLDRTGKAKETVARTEDTVERMRKKKKRTQ